MSRQFSDPVKHAAAKALRSHWATPQKLKSARWRAAKALREYWSSPERQAHMRTKRHGVHYYDKLHCRCWPCVEYHNRLRRAA